MVWKYILYVHALYDRIRGILILSGLRPVCYGLRVMQCDEDLSPAVAGVDHRGPTHIMLLQGIRFRGLSIGFICFEFQPEHTVLRSYKSGLILGENLFLLSSFCRAISFCSQKVPVIELGFKNNTKFIYWQHYYLYRDTKTCKKEKEKLVSHRLVVTLPIAPSSPLVSFSTSTAVVDEAGDTPASSFLRQ